MKTSILALRSLVLLALPLGLFAQAARTTTPETARYESPDDFGTSAGDFEFTIAGTGLADNDVDSSSGGVGASLGYFLNDTLAVVARQTVNYASIDGGGSNWVGSTRVALDQHFGTGRFQPFVGVNAGGIYGEDVEETLTAGLEAGLKVYVQSRTFIFAMVDYAWYFEDSDDADDTFDDGGFQWTVGVGFNF